MSGVGAYLVERRAASGLSLETVAADTRIALRLLRALEEDQFQVLPPPVYVRGFVRAYCERLGEPPDEALRRYDAQRLVERLPEAGVPPPAAAVLRRPPPPEDRRGRSTPRALRLAAVAATAVVVGLVLHRLGLGVGGPQSPGDAGIDRPRPSSPVMETGTGGATTGATEARSSRSLAADATAEAGGRVLVLRADETTWVRVVIQGGEASEALMPPGSVREWHSTGRFRVTLGNAGGVRAEMDGEALPALGARGQVVRDLVLPPEGNR